MTARRLAALAAFAVLAACSGGSKHSSSPASSGAPSAPTTSSASSTAAPSTTAATSSSSACADAAAPPATAQASSDSIDVDGDGKPDTVTVAATGSGADPTPWTVRAELAAGGTRDAQIDPSLTAGGGPVQLLGATSLGPGTPVVFIEVGSGAAASIVALFRLVGCDIAPVATPSGPVTLAVGGTVTHLDGARCASDGLHVLSADSTDGTSYTATDTPYALDGATATARPAQTSTITASDPALQAVGHLSCPGVESP